MKNLLDGAVLVVNNSHVVARKDIFPRDQEFAREKNQFAQTKREHEAHANFFRSTSVRNFLVRFEVIELQVIVGPAAHKRSTKGVTDLGSVRECAEVFAAAGDESGASR